MGQPLLIALDINSKRCENDMSIDFANESVMTTVQDESLRMVTTGPTTIDGATYFVSATFNETAYMEREESTPSIYLMLFVLVMLIALSKEFAGDAQRLVLPPIENMMAIVNMVAEVVIMRHKLFN